MSQKLHNAQWNQASTGQRKHARTCTRNRNTFGEFERRLRSERKFCKVWTRLLQMRNRHVGRVSCRLIEVGILNLRVSGRDVFVVCTTEVVLLNFVGLPVFFNPENISVHHKYRKFQSSFTKTSELLEWVTLSDRPVVIGELFAFKHKRFCFDKRGSHRFGKYLKIKNYAGKFVFHLQLFLA